MLLQCYKKQLFLLMPILPQTFFTFVCRHLVPLSLFSVWHNIIYLEFY
jgi:hypothetical protein